MKTTSFNYFPVEDGVMHTYARPDHPADTLTRCGKRVEHVAHYLSTELHEAALCDEGCRTLS